MADEYVKLDDVLKLLNRNSITKTITFSDGISIYDSVQNLPTADVVAKSEVEKYVDDLKRYIRLNEDIAIKCKKENGEKNEEYWKGKLSAFLQMRGFIDVEMKLKKKYTEEQT